MVVPFTQPPTITHTAPPLVAFNITAGFVYEFETVSMLGLELAYGQLQSMPQELGSNISVTVFQHDVGARITGRISIEQTLPIILQRDALPSLSIAISDPLGGMVVARTELMINPSPPLFDRSDYVFSLDEVTSNGMLLGPIRLIDPNRGDVVAAPVIIAPEGQPRYFIVIPCPEADPDSIYSCFHLLVSFQFDYEHVQNVSVQLRSEDRADPSLTSTATVTVNIMPVNEFTPRFIMNRSVQLELSHMS